MYRYFISYNVLNDRTHGFGNVEHVTSKKIEDIEDIKRIASSIEKDAGFIQGSLVILSFTEFPTNNKSTCIK